MRLLSISKAVGKIKLSIFFTNLDMKQLSNQQNQSLQFTFSTKKRSLPLPDQEDFLQPLPIKKISKVFQNSLTFADTNHSFNDTNLSYSNSINPQINQINHAFTQNRTIYDENSFTSQAKKSEQRKDPLQRIQKMKYLLPKYLAVPLSKAHKTIIMLSSEIDKILWSKAAYQYIESLQNIANQLTIPFQSPLLQFFKQINFLSKNHYKYYKDPLKNIAIGLPTTQINLSLRKSKLQKELYEYNSKAQSNIYPADKLPEQELDFGKTELFCLSTIKKVQYLPTSQQIFHQILEDQIYEKQEILQQYLIKDQPIQFSDIESTIEHIVELFNHYKVKNIFKVNIVQWLQKKSCQLTKSCQLLQQIIKTGLLLHPHQTSKQSIIYQLRQIQKDKLLKHFKNQ